MNQTLTFKETIPMAEQPLYGMGDRSFQAAGGEVGITELVREFYRRMSSDERFKAIFEMHPDSTKSIDRLLAFLCGWLGGPKLYNERFGSINIPKVHAHLPITGADRDAWLTCMGESIDLQPYADDFKEYLKRQLAIPAGVIALRCEEGRASGMKPAPFGLSQ
jgi:hemoglobin